MFFIFILFCSVSCFFQKGNRNTGLPASIVLYGFSHSFTQLRFAFTVRNPEVAESTVLPITIYSITGTSKFLKTFYQYVQNAIVVLSTSPTPQSLNPPTFNPAQIGVASELTITMTFQEDLKSSDFYVIKTTPVLSSSAQASVTNSIALAGYSMTCSLIVLPKLGFVIIKPLSTFTAGSKSCKINNFRNPEDSSSGKPFAAFVTYFSKLSSERINYQLHSLTPDATFPNNPVIFLAPLLTSHNSVLTINLKLNFSKLDQLSSKFLQS